MLSTQLNKYKKTLVKEKKERRKKKSPKGELSLFFLLLFSEKVIMQCIEVIIGGSCPR